MSKYTTGEIAKLCGVTVRTVQYYDTRGILVPSQLSEGGRRLYSDEDLKRLKVICFLRDLDLPIHAIGDLLKEEEPEKVIHLLLEQQEAALRKDIQEQKAKLEKVESLKRELKGLEHLSVESIGDIAYCMENRTKLRRVRAVLLGVGIPLEILELGLLIYAICSGVWWPFLVGEVAYLLPAFLLVRYYHRNVEYICPQCHTVFRPGLWEMIFAKHTYSTRKLTCTHCGHKGFCVETCSGTET